MDLRAFLLVALAAVSSGCATNSVTRQTPDSVNHISYVSSTPLPDGADVVVSIRNADGQPIVPDLHFNAAALPIRFGWPESVLHRVEPVLVDARLELGGQLIAQFNQRVKPGAGLALELLPSALEQTLPELAGTDWRIASYGGRQSLGYTEASLSFGTDGVLRGNGGCNQYNGRYWSHGSLINIEELSSSRKICFASVMYQEHSLFKLLNGVERLSWNNDELLLHVRDIERPVILTAIHTE